MTGKEGEIGGPGSEGACGCTSVRDKGLAQRSDSGLTEEQMIKEIARKQHYRIQRFFKAGRIESIGAVCHKWHIEHHHFYLCFFLKLKRREYWHQERRARRDCKPNELCCQIWFSWPMMVRIWSCRAGAQTQLDDVREILRGCDSQGGGSAGIEEQQK